MTGYARCLICHCCKEANSAGRCSTCQAAYDAAKEGTSYGRYTARYFVPEEASKWKKTARTCLQCGRKMPDDAKPNKLYCSKACKESASYLRKKARRFTNR